MSPEEALLAASAAHLGFQVVVTAVVYPALAEVPGGRWAAAHERHSRRIAAVIGPLYAVVAAACLWALLSSPDAWALAAVGGNALAALLTATVAAPLHGRLASARGRATLLVRLRRVDLARTVSAAAAVVAALLA
ncbi:MAG: hypothetical protein ABWX84_00565 [Nocardioides sp.]